MCKLCDRLWIAHWAESDAWEVETSNLNELLSEESDQTWHLIQRASALEDTDPASALQLFLEAAEAGSVWSLGKVGLHYWKGIGVAADTRIALDFFHRAICGGSWIDTIYYARALAELGQYEQCERVLEDGVKLDFIPSYFWLAWFRSERSATSAVRSEVRPLLEYAARRGHPGADILLVQWMAFGKLRFRDIPRGWRLMLQRGVAFASRENTASAS